MENSLQYQRLNLLVNLGFSPRTILDIGAYQGGWTKKRRFLYRKSEGNINNDRQFCLYGKNKIF